MGRPPLTLAQEVLQGVATGSLVGLVVAATAVPTLLTASVAILSCGMLGALIGLLCWCESADIPDDPVQPPAERRYRPH